MNSARYSELKTIGKLDRFYDVVDNKDNQAQLKKDATFQSFKNEINYLSTQKISKQNTIHSNHTPQYIKDQLFQAQFLQQHSFIIQKYLKTYQHLFQNNCYKQNVRELQKSLLQKSSTGTDVVQFISNFDYFTLKQKKFMEIKTTEYSELPKLLNYIIKTYDYYISIPFIKLTTEIIKIYELHNLKKLSQNQIIQKNNKIIDQQILMTFKKIISGKDQINLNDITPDLKMLTIFLLNTVVFIIEEYYINPYYQLQVQLTIKQYANYELFLYDKSLFNLFLSQQDYIQQNKGRKMIKKHSQSI